MIATGGTVVAALGMLTVWGLSQEQIRVVSVLGSRRGVDHILKEYPGVQIYTGAVDELLTDKGYISPGLGDAVSLSRRRCLYTTTSAWYEGFLSWADSIGRPHLQHRDEVIGKNMGKDELVRVVMMRVLLYIIPGMHQATCISMR
jgi:hypothetical protein